MDRATAKTMWPLIKAYAEGADIEILGVVNGWRKEENPNFLGDPSWYRIKDEELNNEQAWWAQQNQDDEFINDQG